MTKSRDGRKPDPHPDSAVDALMLERYLIAAPMPPMHREIRALYRIGDECEVFLAAGDRLHALGAGLVLVDIALKVAATPVRLVAERRRKAEFFRRRFRSLVESFGHGHVAALAEAALAAESRLESVRPNAVVDAAHHQPRKGMAFRRKTATVITLQDRMQDYADNVEDLQDVRTVMVTNLTIRRIVADHVILAQEGRTEAMKGAERILADMVRRLCATLATHEFDAKAKLGVLFAMRSFYAADEHGALMVAMIEAAVGMEKKSWSVASTRH